MASQLASNKRTLARCHAAKVQCSYMYVALHRKAHDGSTHREVRKTAAATNTLFSLLYQYKLGHDKHNSHSSRSFIHHAVSCRHGRHGWSRNQPHQSTCFLWFTCRDAEYEWIAELVMPMECFVRSMLFLAANQIIQKKPSQPACRSFLNISTRGRWRILGAEDMLLPLTNLKM
jgi:hypothetical protein